MVMAYLGGIHFWWPKMFGRMYPEFLARFATIVIFVGFNLTFMPQFIVGFQGMPRRYHVYPEEFGVFNLLSSAGASILGIGYLLPMLYLPWSLKWGKKVGRNPWEAKGLEWEEVDSPPITHNFHGPVVVTQEAYAYGEEHAPHDIAPPHAKGPHGHKEATSVR
jgi:cytochrome c oxidase subunit 1